MARVTEGAALAAEVSERAQTLVNSLTAARTARVRRDVWARVIEHADVLLQAADRLQKTPCLFRTPTNVSSTSLTTPNR